ncbi:hypothetical protein GCM10007416_13660 [Kroppenstedtia guangzhouensis]|uniref:Uncharacterized protein n=1 Tax=Kroppenstedtia guangzhouensis TaxID=1274356 RepID=A0ABQ1GDZ2_9BACL|nr:hypothetical protein [Kroppenstedtia guangzhouensis]GGA41992.1 hypothetical protein GCM10007416_13660 [Kroppenstedtia guangzhouensis]
MDQAQRIEMKSVASDQVRRTLTEKKELERFVAKQRIEEWETESRLPKGAKPSYEYIFYQEETVKAGEKKEKDAPLHVVARLITYGGASLYHIESLLHRIGLQSPGGCRPILESDLTFFGFLNQKIKKPFIQANGYLRHDNRSPFKHFSLGLTPRL